MHLQMILVLPAAPGLTILSYYIDERPMSDKDHSKISCVCICSLSYHIYKELSQGTCICCDTTLVSFDTLGTTALMLVVPDNPPPSFPKQRSSLCSLQISSYYPRSTPPRRKSPPFGTIDSDTGTMRDNYNDHLQDSKLEPLKVNASCSSYSTSWRHSRQRNQSARQRRLSVSPLHKSIAYGRTNSREFMREVLPP